MQYMYKVMEDKNIPEDSKIAIEYRIPNSNKRVDFIVSGEDGTGRESAVIIELKQWQHVEKGLGRCRGQCTVLKNDFWRSCLQWP